MKHPSEFANLKELNMRLATRILRWVYFRKTFAKIFAFLTLTGLLIVSYFLLDEEDFFSDDEPWPGLVYRSPGRKHSMEFENEIGPLPQGNSELIEMIQKPLVTLAVVSCKSQSRMDEAMTMLKSAVLFSKNVRLNIIAVSDRRAQSIFAQMINELRNIANGIGLDVEYEVYRSWFPKEDHRIWRRMWLPCSSQRLFFPSMFKHLDSIMYIDTDVYFVSDLRNLWQYFESMNSEHLAAMAAEHELPGDGWYNLYSKIPYYGPRGLNAGIMLMNLTRMREIKLEERAASILETYGKDLMWADQDILNILFHFYPEYLFELKCEYNFRAQHCKCDYPDSGECGCNSAKQNGAAIIHGNRARFHYYADPTLEFLRGFYNDFKNHDLAKNRPEELYTKLKESYDAVRQQPCKMSCQNLLLQFERYLSS